MRAAWPGAGALEPDGSLRDIDQHIPDGLLALCSDAQGQLWAAAAHQAGTVIVPLQADGGIQVQWRVAAIVQCLRWRAEDEVLFATAPETGDILMLQPGAADVRRLATMPKGSGLISGLAFHSDGGIWTCLRGGWGVVRFAPDGGLDRVIGLPVPYPTDLAFDSQGEKLYVATARQPVSLDALGDAPLSGWLFRIRP